MTREEIMALSGRELDAAVAERVMGWKRVYGHPNLRDGDWWRNPADELGWYESEVPHYSTDISAAWEVVERLTEFEIDDLDLTVEVGNVMVGWACWVYSGCEEVAEAREETAPLAICRAALLAVAERLGEKDRSE